MSKLSKLPKHLPLLLLLFVSLNLFSQKRGYPHVGEGGSESKQTKIKHSFSKFRLDENAKETGLGYKTSNLMELENVVENLRDQLPAGYNAAVPHFVGITSDEIKAFFNKNGLNIQARWNEIKSSMDVCGPIEYLKNLENRKKFIEKSEKLAEDIEKLDLSSANLTFETVSNFLSKASTNGWRLMVRSTGKEDTKELPNAGGNHSEPNVYPDKVSVINAIKKVVASYFKEKSLSQRIDAGDKGIFSDPLTPVLLQRMIGEQNSKEIPVGCVVYTGEVEGATPGVVTIQAAFGHNEGVVNSEVAVDTYYVKDKNIRPIIQRKNQRIIPIQTDEEYGLKLINNPNELKNKQALSDEDILAIDVVARAVHDYYSEAMDIELVFEPSTRTIYLVQARPLQVVDAVVASYIKDIKNISSDNIAKCSTVSAAGGSLRHVTNKNQIITASTLDAALDKDLSSGVDRSQISAVIVNGNAEPTSHAATTFRGAGKCILTCDEMGKLEKWLSEGNVNLYVDVQREVVVNAKDLIDIDDFIKIGWFKHPISQRLSIGDAEFIAPKFTTLFDKLIEFKTRKELIERIKTSPNVEATRALKMLLAKIANTLKAGEEIEKPSLLQKQTFDQLQKVYNVVVKLAEEMLENEIFKKNPQDIERLYAINFLEAILFQPKETSKYVDVFSVKSVFDDYGKMYEFIKDKFVTLGEDKKTPVLDERVSLFTQSLPALHFAMTGCDELYTDEIQDKWINFVYGVFKSDEENQNNFIKFLNEIEKMEVLPAWINISFSGQVLKSNNAIENLNNLVAEYDQVKDILDILKQKKEQLESYNVSRWNEASKFQSNLDSFEKNFLNYYMSDEFFELLGKAKERQLAIIVLTSLMDKFVDTFDKSIKALKASTKYKSDIDKVKDFKIIVGKYWNLFEIWAMLIPEGSIQYYGDLQSYEKEIIKNFQNITDFSSKQLNPSAGFSVAAAIIGVNPCLNLSLPETTEDLFTLIHQNLLVISGTIFNKYCDVLVINTTKLFKRIQEEFLKVSCENGNPSFIFTSFLNDQIIFHYNLPLRTHGVLFDLYMNKDDTVSIKYNFVGADIQSRWKTILCLAAICSLLDNTFIFVDSIGDNELLFIVTYKSYKDFVLTSNLQSQIEFFITISMVPYNLFGITDLRSAVYGYSGDDVFLEKIIQGLSNLDISQDSIVGLEMKTGYINAIIGFLIDSSNEEAVRVAGETLKNIFSADRGFELKKVSLPGVSGLINSKNEEAIRVAVEILQNIFSADGGLELKKVSLPGVSGLINSKNEEAIRVAVEILQNIFSADGGLELKKVSLPGVSGLINSKNEEAIRVAVEILQNIFSADGDLELKKEFLRCRGAFSALIDSKNKEAIRAAVEILKNIFSSDGDLELKKEFLRWNSVLVFIHSGNEEAIRVAVEILEEIFSSDGDLELKKMTLRWDSVSNLIYSGNEKAIKIIVAILKKIFSSDGDFELKKEFLRCQRVLSAIICSDNEEATRVVVEILKKLFSLDGDLDLELKKMILCWQGVFSDLIGSRNEEAIKAAIEILKNIFDGDSEELKQLAKKRFGGFIKKQGI